MAESFGMWIIAQQDAGLPQAPGVASGTAAAPTGAAATTADPAAHPVTPPANPLNSNFMFFAFALMGLMIVSSVMASRKEKKRRGTLMTTLKRHDRVLLTGGMIATVVEVRDDEIIVKVDDSTNTRIHFMKSAVQQVLKSASDESSSAPESSAA